eukprot:304059-Chlamydomonas_euryale.AAC.2
MWTVVSATLQCQCDPPVSVRPSKVSATLQGQCDLPTSVRPSKVSATLQGQRDLPRSVRPSEISAKPPLDRADMRVRVHVCAHVNEGGGPIGFRQLPRFQQAVGRTPKHAP